MLPGEPAPAAGDCQERNVLRNQIARYVAVTGGERLLVLPHRATWALEDTFRDMKAPRERWFGQPPGA